MDQTYYSDEKMKDVEPANTKVLLEQVKNPQVQTFTHKESEFFNKFFNQRQLGIMASTLKKVMLAAVSQLPERRFTAKNASLVNKNEVRTRTCSSARWGL